MLFLPFCNLFSTWWPSKIYWNKSTQSQSLTHLKTSAFRRKCKLLDLAPTTCTICPCFSFLAPPPPSHPFNGASTFWLVHHFIYSRILSTRVGPQYFSQMHKQILLYIFLSLKRSPPLALGLSKMKLEDSQDLLCRLYWVPSLTTSAGLALPELWGPSWVKTGVIQKHLFHQ